MDMERRCHSDFNSDGDTGMTKTPGHCPIGWIDPERCDPKPKKNKMLGAH